MLIGHESERVRLHDGGEAEGPLSAQALPHAPLEAIDRFPEDTVVNLGLTIWPARTEPVSQRCPLSAGMGNDPGYDMSQSEESHGGNDDQ